VGKLCLRYARSAHSHETRLHARLYDALNTLGVLGADGLEPGHTIHTAGPALHGATLAGHHGNAGLGAEASGIKCDSALRTVPRTMEWENTVLRGVPPAHHLSLARAGQPGSRTIFPSMNQYGYTSPTLCCVPTSLQPCGLTATRISLTLSDRALPQTYLLYPPTPPLESAPHLHETVLRRLICYNLSTLCSFL